MSGLSFPLGFYNIRSFVENLNCPSLHFRPLIVDERRGLQLQSFQPFYRHPQELDVIEQWTLSFDFRECNSVGSVLCNESS